MARGRNRHRQREIHGRKTAVATVMAEKDTGGRLRFAAPFLGASLLLFGVIHLLPSDLATPINRHTARVLAKSLEFLGYDAVQNGEIVKTSRFAVSIITECTALFSCGLFSCFVLSCPSRWKARAIGLLAGLPMLYFLNLVRLVVIFAVGVFNPALFEWTHVYMGQVFTIGSVFAACYLWLKGMSEAESLRVIAKKAASLAIVRFSFISTLLFILWFKINSFYMSLIDRIMFFGFSLFGQNLAVTHTVTVYYYTFNLVTFASLFLASNPTAFRTKKERNAFFLGLGVIVFSHLLCRTGNALIGLFQSALLCTLWDLTRTASQYLLPIILWYVLTKAHDRAQTGKNEHRESRSSVMSSELASQNRPT